MMGNVSSSSTIKFATVTGPQRQNLPGILLLITLWLAQVQYPPLSYPALGLCLLPIIVAMAFLMLMRAFAAARTAGSAVLRHSALLPGFALVVWVVIRWAAEGFPASGSTTVGTHLWSATYLGIAFFLYSTPAKTTAKEGFTDSLFTIVLLVALSALGLLCGLHAVWQYHVAYADSYQALLASIGGRTPDRTEAALLHHLQLRRVASIWGDPNTLATFSAMSLCASFEIIISRLRPVVLTGILSVASIIACAAAIYYTGSRGGALDAIGVFFIYGILLMMKLSFGRNPRLGIAALLLTITALGIIPAGSQGQTGQTTSVTESQPAKSSWAWRSDTVRERLFYLQVGARMITMAPVAGLGPGSVELYFGRLKPPEARETKYLHNWIAQTWAETGLVGLGFTLWFISAVTVGIMRARLWRTPFDRALGVLFFLILFDGLLQVSWNQREIMSLFGLVCGILIARTGSLSPPGPFRFRQSSRLTGFLGITALFTILEAPFLVGASSKQMARDAMYAGNQHEAEEQWKRASEWAPRDPEPFAARASMATISGEISSARMLIEKALKLNPESASTHAQAADIYERLGQNREAFAHIKDTIRIYPTNPEYNFLYAKRLEELGQQKDALVFAKRAVEYNYLPESESKYEALVTKIADDVKGSPGN